MRNLNPEEHDNVINPYILSKEAQDDVMEAVDDKWLSNPPGDYFKIQTSDGVLDVPKLKNISRKTSRGKIRGIPIKEFIKDELDEQ